MPKPTLQNIFNVIAFLEQSPDDVHSHEQLRLTNEQVAGFLRAIHTAYVPDDAPNKKRSPQPRDQEET